MTQPHKPGCMANMNCAVYHADGVCPGPYGKCTCDAMPEATPFVDGPYKEAGLIINPRERATLEAMGVDTSWMNVTKDLVTEPMPDQEPKPGCTCTATHEGPCQDSRAEEKCPGEHCVYSSLEICPFDGSIHTPTPRAETWEGRFDEKFGKNGGYLCQYDGKATYTSVPEEVKSFIASEIQSAVEAERRKGELDGLERAFRIISKLPDCCNKNLVHNARARLSEAIESLSK